MQHSYTRDFLENLLNPLRPVSLTQRNNDCLHISYENLSDIGSLSEMSNNISKFFPLTHGQIVICNDPYIGGSTLNNLCLVMGIKVNGINNKKTGDNSADLILCRKIYYRPNLKICNKIDDEGLRIPPTPICDNKNIQVGILEAIGSHPSAPDQFVLRTKKALDELLDFLSHFDNQCKLAGFNFTPDFCKSYLKYSHQKMQKLITELPHSESNAKFELITGETGELKIEIQADSFHFQFHKLSKSEQMFLTRSACLGACVGASLFLFGCNIPINSGVLNAYQLSIPNDAFLNAKYPQPMWLGMSEGIEYLASQIQNALSQIISKKDVSNSALGSCNIDLEFANNTHFFDSLSGGSGALKHRDGSTGVNIWRMSKLQASIEEIEKRFPLVIECHSNRPGSSGEGKFNGGEGIIRTYRLLDNAKLRWLSLQSKSANKGNEGAYAGQAAQIILYRANEKAKKLDSWGELELKAGDRICVLSAGGGGFGRNKNI